MRLICYISDKIFFLFCVLTLLALSTSKAQTVNATIKIVEIYSTANDPNEAEDYRINVWYNGTYAGNCLKTSNTESGQWISTNFTVVTNWPIDLKTDITLRGEGWNEDDCKGDCSYNDTDAGCDDGQHCGQTDGVLVEAPSGVTIGGASFKLYDLAPGNVASNFINIKYCGNYWVKYLVNYTIPTPSAPSIALGPFEPGVNGKPSDNPLITLSANSNLKSDFNSSVTYTYYYNLNGSTKTVWVNNPSSCAGTSQCDGAANTAQQVSNDKNTNESASSRIASPSLVEGGGGDPPSCCYEPKFIQKTVIDWKLLGTGSDADPYEIYLRNIPNLCSSVSSGVVYFYVVTSINSLKSSNSSTSSQGYDRPKIKVEPQGNQCQNTSINLSVPVQSAFSSYGWEYKIGTGNSTALASTTGNSKSVNGSSFPLNQQIFFRTKVANCYSDYAGAVVFYPPAPSINMSQSLTKSPSCIGEGVDLAKFENGKISIVHDLITANEAFIYTVQQWIPRPNNDKGNCSSLNLPDIEARNFGTETSPSWYCKGYIANFVNTNGATEFELSNTNKTDKSDTHFTFKKGKYSVKVESKKVIDESLSNPSSVLSCPSEEYYFDIQDPPSMSLSQNGASITPSCFGGNDGSASFTINNGVGDFSWKVIDKNGTVDNLNRTFTISNLSKADYTLEVTDKFCQKNVNLPFTIANGPSFTVEASGEPLKCLTDNDNNGITEGDGIVTATADIVQGKTYSFYLYTSGGSLVDSELNQTSNTYSFPNLSNLSYYVTTTTSNNCTNSSSTVTLDKPSPLTLSAEAINATCSNSSDGRIRLTDISKPDGTINYSYVLSKPGDASFTDISPTSPVKSALTKTLSSSLGVGTYKVVVTDLCSISPNTITFNNLLITRPSPLSIDPLNNLSIACYDGTSNATITVKDGTPTYTLDVRKNGVSMTGYPNTTKAIGTFALNSLGLGNYRVVATENCNASGVTDFSTFRDFSVTSNATSPIQAEITKLKYDNNNDGTVNNNDHHLTCIENNDGRIELKVQGGIQGTMPKYSIELLNANGTATLVNNTTNNNNINGIISDGGLVNGKMVYSISKLAEDITYQIRVTDYNSSPGGCVKQFTQDILNENLSLTAPLALTIKIPDVSLDFANLALYNGSLYAICKGNEDGIYTSKISGGNPPYTVKLFKKTLLSDNWPTTPFKVVSGSSGTSTFSGLGAGFYQVEVTDQQNCGFSARNFQIHEATTPIQVDDITAQVFAHGANTTCYGGTDGSIQVTVSGGVGNYSYSLNSDDGYNSGITKIAATNTFTGLPAIKANGDTIIYTIGLRDEIGCVWQGGDPVSEFYKLAPPDTLEFSRNIVSKTFPGYEIPCKGEEATVRFTSEGGKYPHYITINGVTKTIVNNSSYADFYLPAGTYTATFEDELHCTASAQTFTLNEPSSHVAVSIDSVMPPVCIGGMDGQVNLSATGGIQGTLGIEYIFLLKKDGYSTFDSDTLRGATASFLRAANGFTSQDYIAMGIDKHGCTHESQFTMPVNPSPLTLSDTEIVSPSCYGGTNGHITLKAINHTFIEGNQLKFKLSGGHLGNVISEVVESSDTYTFTNLQATDLNGYGPYHAWVEDANVCADTAYQYLPALMLPSFEPLKLDLVKAIRPSCFNGSDGSLEIQISGGVPPYQYSQDNLTFFDVASDQVIFTNALTSGNYLFYLKDANYDPDQPTCLNTTVFDVPLGRFLRLEASTNNVSCKDGNDGSIDLTINLDNLNAGESLDPNRLSMYWQNTALSSLPMSISEDLNSLHRGNYTVSVNYNVDSLVCTQQKTVNILEPATTFRISEIKTYDASCGGHADGKAVVTITGGWPNTISYYKLDNGSWRMLTGSSFILTNLGPGNHDITISQQNYSCVDTETFVISSSKLDLNVAQILAPTCPMQADGAIVLNSSGNTNVEYALEGNPFQTISVFSGLAQGTYRFEARKINETNCESEVIEVSVVDPEDCGEGPLTITLLGTKQSTCESSYDGEAAILVNGGVPPYKIYWDNSTTPGDVNQNGLNTGLHTVTVIDAVSVTTQIAMLIEAKPALTMETFSTLASCASTCDGTAQVLVSGGSGEYLITWSDGSTDLSHQNLCVGTIDFTVIDVADSRCSLQSSVNITHHPELAITQLSSAPPVCPGGVNGYVSVQVEGGSNQYNLQWSNMEAVTMLTNTIPGTYSLTVTDKILGCTVTKDFAIPDAVPITVQSADITQPDCNGGSNGKIQLTLTNTNQPLVRWSNGQIGLIATGLKAGTYQYTITGSTGCSVTGNVMVEDRPEIRVTSNSVNPTCFGLCNGEIALGISGGTTPYSIVWSHGPKVPAVKNLCSGTYTYTVKDKYNCSVSGAVVINAPEPVNIVLTSKKDASCLGSKDGALEIIASGGTGDYQYNWNTGDTESHLSGIYAGQYIVTVNDANSCTAKGTYNISEPTLLQLKEEALTHPSCPTSLDGKIAVKCMGGTEPYQYRWQDDITTDDRSGLRAGLYNLTVIDNKGCRANKSFTLIPPVALELVNVKRIDPSCFEYHDGSINIEVAGGTAPYTYEWGHGGSENLTSALKAGSYSVTVTDNNLCTTTGAYTLTDPPKPLIFGLPENTLLCTGSTTTLEPEGTWTHYSWKDPNGQEFIGPRYETGVNGMHTLTAWDVRNCPAEKSFNIEVSDNPLKTDFLRLSEAIVFQPVVFVDISVPVPTSIEWLLPEDPDVVVNNRNGNSIELVFTRSGNFEIGLRGTLDKCMAELYKTVDVREQTDGDANNGGRLPTADAEDVVNLTIYPSPAQGIMNIQVAAHTRDEIVLRLISALDNRQVASQHIEGQLDYLVRWDVSSVSAGLYFLVYEHHGNMYSKRVLVIR